MELVNRPVSSWRRVHIGRDKRKRLAGLVPERTWSLGQSWNYSEVSGERPETRGSSWWSFPGGEGRGSGPGRQLKDCVFTPLSESSACRMCPVSAHPVFSRLSLVWPLVASLDLPHCFSSPSVSYRNEFVTASRPCFSSSPFWSTGLLFLLCVNSPFHFLQAPADDILPPEGVPWLPYPHLCLCGTQNLKHRTQHLFLGCWTCSCPSWHGRFWRAFCLNTYLIL